MRVINDEDAFSLDPRAGTIGRTKVRGAARRPTRKEREKFRVASAERNMPRRRSEKHWIRMVSCTDRRRKNERVKAVKYGRPSVRRPVK